ncbi:MAG: hypothetical protein RBT49_11590 [Bacteroidales bacterium]|jgi:hypothetical protein|nr:hypothetical protein [Bacteroidales bacterium]
MRLIKNLALLLILTFSILQVSAQGSYEELLMREVEVENPVFMPVIGLGAGFINYYGELKNDTKNILQGNPSYRINVYMPLGKKHYWKANLNVLFGTMSGYERSYTDTSKNLNFTADITSFGINFEYNFGHLFKSERMVRPFLSLGAEYFTISSNNTDLNNNLGAYQYFPDGTIRISDQITQRDYIYETPIQKINRFGNDGYSQGVPALVADIGLDFKISNRVILKIATSLHYTFYDEIDDVSSKNSTGRIGDSRKDMFSMTYTSINIDLFSDPRTKMIQDLFMDITGDFDYTIIADTDNDGVTELIDDCYNTPAGVEVDSVGCPLDMDRDGVPDYRDKDPSSITDAIVDEHGVQMSGEEILSRLLQNYSAVGRSEAYMIPIGQGWSKYSKMTNVEIPEKFKSLDIDNDNYISFDELLKAVNRFFDEDETDFKPEDIYELNDFFFAQ